jgi:hypothetical protein
MRQFFWPNPCLLLLLALVAIPVSRAAAQLDVGYDPPPLQGVTTAYVPESQQPTAFNAQEPTVADLLARLEQTEAQLAAIQAERYGMDPLAVDTAARPFRDYWEQVRDPSIVTVGQQTHNPNEDQQAKKKWYERLSIRGYAQFRINRVTEEEPGSAPAQYVGDRSVGDNQSFIIRRARVIVSGDVSEHLYVYLQPDFASSVPGSPDANQFCQIRDWYGDVYLDDSKVWRIRVGQSKIPYGWENLQSSSNRLPLDRDDALNSAVRNERDLGVMFYWTPEGAQDLFKYVLDEGLKGSGNYGVFGFGCYNGQGGSFNEQNDNLHLVARLAVPWQFESGQVMEWGLQGYTGKYAVLSSLIRPLGVGGPIRPLGTLEQGTNEILDERMAATFVWYPQPWGFQTEWNVGRGPGLNDAQTEVIDRSLTGGYAMTMYRYESDCHGVFIPFLRWQYYEGGYKAERNAPYVHIDEWELGLEWQFNPQMELTAQYTFTDRTNTVAMPNDESYRQFVGEIARLQFQINY